MTDSATYTAVPLQEEAIQRNGQAGSITAISSKPFTSVVDKEERQNQQESQVPCASLSRSRWALILVLGYSVLAIVAWTILCILTYRPITTQHYDSYFGRTYHVDVQAIYARNESWLRAARVIQAIVGVLTIPLTSAVCTKAAVVFAQQKDHLSLRQLITLADRGWTSPLIYSHLLRGRFSRYGSSFLYIAILLNILGATISPLQSVFLRVSTTKTPSSAKVITGVSDVLDLLETTGEDINLISVLTRSAITTTSSTDPQARLWTLGQIDCNISSSWYDVPASCNLGATTLDNITQLIDPFVAHLPAQFSTGLVQQFIPRINSSARRERIEAISYPTSCDGTGAFYVRYHHDGMANNTNFAGNWSISACMPADQTVSPWQATRDRQDITEDLFLNITINGFTDTVAELYRISLNTSLGYFELPNYANGEKPGPLLDKVPSSRQLPLSTGHYRRDINNGTAGMSNSSVTLQATPNKGPLLLIAMALFGSNSFIANRFQHPESFIYNYTNVDFGNEVDNGANETLFSSYCVDQEPMLGLLTRVDIEQDGVDNSLYPGCIQGTNNQPDVLNRQVEQWLRAFTTGFTPERIVNAFEAAAFLANEAWLIKGGRDPSLYVNYDLGSDTEVPLISLAGVVLISVLLFLYISGLFTMAFYVSRTYVWTQEFDAFAMMRIGAAISEKLPLTYVKNVDQVRMLDEMSGWVGDASGGKGPVGELGLGVSTSLARGRSFRCYDEGKTR